VIALGYLFPDFEEEQADVPMQDFSKPWTDEELYKKYELTQNEINYIESSVWSSKGGDN